ncbi:MAG: beta-ketoacyl synthase [Aphanizomenon flos-aquae LD13]|uniref:Beta-ketoacyl synthase n=1 Tax=Aphanizomenon flos-aquae LD13 TaxID=1710894 RepID=A0A1B7VUZ7_APHFL|nr:SDR family NAD(P)-dependent oxidoreductase [Aphanizomenon flos-aquae UKL13-PB]OBQ24800.1 MAG: beta-ketoacyl synthase [Aphanizomenon flos-aquae LD13]HCQ21077.1 beta-ketoacyl synthase [Anabaena sp. UBA12330]
MAASKFEVDFAQLQSEISNCEKSVLKMITVKKNMPDTTKMKNEINAKLRTTNVAIIGMASIFPQAKNLQEYWENIIQKVDCITDVPASRWHIDDYYDPDPKAPDKTYCKRGGFLPDIDFNPMKFGLPPNILEVTDISQLLGLVVAKEAIEDAGYGVSRQFNHERTGVVLGVAIGRQLAVPLGARLQDPLWKKVLKNSGLSDEDSQKIIEKIKSGYVQWEENAFPGMLANVISGRIANRLDLGGMNCVVDAACASSLGALRMAISELVEHRADMMITGGVDTDNSIFAYMCFSKTPAVSPGDKVKPFDADADGMMLGEGVGMLVLKRLEDAQRDGDRIYAVIKGVGSSSDGKYKSIYAPRPEGQINALHRAYNEAGISPASIGLIEAHGTGTMVGDPTEFTSITTVFGENNPKKQHIALGTVKSQIGHTKAAAGAASLIKAALALHHKVLPPTINVSKPHPKLNIENSPFYLNTETRPWISHPTQPRRAGVSAFGFGGTNYHVVLEEYEHEHHHPYRLHHTPQSLLLFAPTASELLSRCQQIQQQLQIDGKEQHYQQLVTESQIGKIPVNYARVGFVANDLAQAGELLEIVIKGLKQKPEAESWEHPQGIYYRQAGIDARGKVVALFSGQGSQYLEMGRELVINFPCLRQTYTHMDSLLCEDGLQPLSTIVFPKPVFDQAQKQAQLATLQKTEYAQPAIGVFSAGLYKILQQAGFKPDFVAGHSFGELTALWAAGVLSEEDYLFLVKARGQAMATPANSDFDAGGMLAVKGNIHQITEVIKNFPLVAVANRNSQHQIVLAGKKKEISQVQDILKNQGFSTFLLGVSAAFHTPLVSHAQKPFAQAVEKVNFNEAKIPVYTNVTGGCYPQEPHDIQKILKEQLLNQVLFQQEIENIYAAGGYCFVEFGPKNILTNLVKEILADKPHIAIALNANHTKNSDCTLREAIIQLQVAGLSLENLDPYQVATKIPEVPQQKVLNVRLNSTNITEKTQKAFAKALENGHHVEVVSPQPTVNNKPPTSFNGNKELQGDNKPPNSFNGKQELQGDNKPTNSLNSKLEEIKIQPQNYEKVIHSLENFITEFSQQHRDIINVHEQSLHNQTEYTKTFSQLMQQQYSLLGNSELTEDQSQNQQLVISSSERNMMRFHDHQGDTLRIHEQYLKYQHEYSHDYFQLLQQHFHLLTSENRVISYINQPQSANFVVKEPICSPQVPEELENDQKTITIIPKIPINIDKTTLSKTLLNVVSEKTGYPVEMLELSMDMEADLGIDSIKRVEILGGLLEIYPDLPKPNPEELGQLRTLEQIAEYMQTLVPDILNKQVEISTAITTTEVLIEVPKPKLIISPLEIEEQKPVIEIPENLSHILLTIVSEKTGYPVEMLELSMDIEADLGIDSIKKVEILGGLLEIYPDLPKPNPEEIGELRTLGEIANYMQQQAQGITKLLTEEILEISTTQFQPNIRRSIAKLQQLPIPDSLEFSLSDNHIALITDDGSDITNKLATSLTAKGWKTVVLSFPGIESTVNEDINKVVLTDWNEETLEQNLKQIADNYGTVAAFIHLQPATPLNVDKSILLHVFLIAKYLKEPLKKASKFGRSCFINVAHLDGEFGLGETHKFSAIAGGLFGLSKTINQEWENVFCRSLDLNPDLDPETSVKHILAEIYDPNLLIQEVGYSSKGRVNLIADFAPLPINNPQRNITKNQVFLVSGGAKGITAQCVIKIAQEYQCKFILLGRSSAEPEPVWSENCKNEAELKQRILENFQAQGEKPTPIMVQKKYQVISSQREIQNTLKAIEKAGGKAEYLSVDITDTVLLESKLADVIERFGVITGIIHGAGNLADKRIEKKSIQDFENVYAAKVKGLENLLLCVPASQLQYLVLFSSVVGFYGNVGQSDYAIANEILNKSAHLIKHNYPNCHVMAINWGPWESGMVSPELKKAFAERGIEVIPVETGIQILIDELNTANQDAVQLVIGSPLIYVPATLSNDLKTYRIKRQLTLAENPFLQDHVIASRPVLPATCGLLWMTNACEQIYPGFTAFSSTNFKVLKGIIFDESLINEYVLEIQELAKHHNQEIEFAAKISSKTSDGKIRYHFSANLILKREIPAPPSYGSLNFNQDEELLKTNQELYQVNDCSLFHGITFQGVKSVLNISHNQITIECYLTEPTAQQKGQFPVQTFNPYISDVQIHSLWIWTQYFHQVGCLPSEIKNFEQFAKVPFGETFYVTCEVQSKTESSVITNVITYNHQGQIYNRMIGAKGTILPRPIAKA